MLRSIKEPFAVLSNLVFLVPLCFAAVSRSYIHAALILFVFAFSVIFHIVKPTGAIFWRDTTGFTLNQKVFLWIDTTFANMLILFNLFVFWQRGFPSEFYYAVGIAIIALGFFFFPNRWRYDFSEGVWHMLGGVVTLIAVCA